MLVTYLVPLTVGLAFVALLCSAGALVAVRRSAAASRDMARTATAFDARGEALPGRLAAARASMAEQGAAAEHIAWSLVRFDEQLDKMTVDMARRRAGLDELRAKLESSKVNLERLKSAAHLIMRAIELRRAFLG